MAGIAITTVSGASSTLAQQIQPAQNTAAINAQQTQNSPAAIALMSQRGAEDALVLRKNNPKRSTQIPKKTDGTFASDEDSHEQNGPAVKGKRKNSQEKKEKLDLTA